MKCPVRKVLRRGMVVMVCIPNTRQRYPVKLVKRTRIGEGKCWFDTLDNVEREDYMRPLTRRERGGK